MTSPRHPTCQAAGAPSAVSGGASHTTISTYSTLSAAAALIIRPGDQHALAALRQLARQNGTHVQCGVISLAGARRPAWLAFSRDGRLLVVVLLDATAATCVSPPLATPEHTRASEVTP